ncbi:MAG: class I SAM-dependent methyltransferase [Rhizobiaceae bacterium]|nr:class I SAM-dependent methyltransferase [Rhizobiaceae bacterium]
MTVFPDQAALDYDERIVRLVPGYALALDLMGCILATRASAPSRILAPGCGTGSEIAVLARQLPHARFTALDPSAGMLDAARSKLAATGSAERTAFVHGMLDDLPEEPHDAATVSLVLHFLPDDGSKATFLEGVGRHLSLGAPLLLFDATVSEGADEGLALWLARQGHSAEAVQAVLTRMKTQWRRATRERVDELLAEAGFTAGRPFFQAFGFLGVHAERRSAG